MIETTDQMFLMVEQPDLLYINTFINSITFGKLIYLLLKP